MLMAKNIILNTPTELIGEQQTNMKHSALRRAIEQGDLRAVQVAIEDGANIEEADMHGDPGLPLRIACFKGHADIVQELLRRGANARAPNAHGTNGAIRMAAKARHHQIVKLLIAHGAELPDEPASAKTKSDDRRQRHERRKRNSGPPRGLSERRDLSDRRVTSVREIELDEAQWDNYFSQSTPSAPTAPFPTLFDPADQASQIFDRARD